MEPERKIEKLLRAFGGKRRAQAKDPFALHPANRRLLHAEVRKEFPQAGRGRGSAWLFRFAPALGLLAVVALLAAILLQSFSAAKHRSESAMASAQIEERARIEEKPASVENAPAESQPTAGSKVFSEGDSLWFTNALAPDIRDRELRPDKAGSLSVGLTAATPPPASVPARSGTAATLPETARAPIYFRSVADSRTGQSAAEMVVLSDFSLRQTASNLLVVDADGSVYQSQPYPSHLYFDRLATNAMSSGYRSVTAAPVVQPEGSLTFQVSGTNRTLNQLILFNGTFFTGTNAAVSTAFGIFSTIQNLGIVTDLRGTAVLGSHRELRIDAVAVPTNRFEPASGNK